jgi:ABC-type transport system involved in multi-copper enzyme maturation permease subunit
MLLGKFIGGVSVIMAIIVVVGGLLAGAAVFAALKNTSKSRESKVTKLNIG